MMRSKRHGQRRGLSRKSLCAPGSIVIVSASEMPQVQLSGRSFLAAVRIPLMTNERAAGLRGNPSRTNQFLAARWLSFTTSSPEGHVRIRFSPGRSGSGRVARVGCQTLSQIHRL
jgi:hypothetical protein